MIISTLFRLDYANDYTNNQICASNELKSYFDTICWFNLKSAEFYKYAYLAAAYNRREKKENWDDREESGFRAESRSSPIGLQDFSTNVKFLKRAHTQSSLKAKERKVIKKLKDVVSLKDTKNWIIYKKRVV